MLCQQKSINTPIGISFQEWVLTVNMNGTVWLFIRADFGLLKLGEMLMVSLVCTVAVHGHHIQNDTVVDHPVNSRHGGHRILECIIMPLSFIALLVRAILVLCN